ncbi:hypothetical protein [Thioalkalivibrio sp. HK1]|uniref:hypothetical protein n=1 Tax=Thioalkalivibrio sp. HK1 TaxID=1469245 RepID=UPI0004727865|nr:hypothetical protein [Thioalkalivibrio sp. HK1]
MSTEWIVAISALAASLAFVLGLFLWIRRMIRQESEWRRRGSILDVERIRSDFEATAAEVKEEILAETLKGFTQVADFAVTRAVDLAATRAANLVAAKAADLAATKAAEEVLRKYTDIDDKSLDGLTVLRPETLDRSSGPE